jgi:NAD(P)-dependent dehydrogenase (short-subunit alcohol dehydrogenase family)
MAVLHDKVAIITGAANGIGRAIAARFAAEGARVVVSDRDAAHGEALVTSIAASGGHAVFVRADVSIDSDMHMLFNRALEIYGGVHIMINNAGIEGPNVPMAEYDMAEFDRVIDVNLRGVFLGMQAAVKHMATAGGGVILNMSSVAGLKGFATLSPYTASKHAVVGLTKAVALEYATQNIRVNAICPGVVITDMIHRITKNDPAVEDSYAKLQPMGRMGTPDEIAEVALFLCSDASSFLTGVALPADGGIMAG